MKTMSVTYCTNANRTNVYGNDIATILKIVEYIIPNTNIGYKNI